MLSMMPVRFVLLAAIVMVAACAPETQAPPVEAAPTPVGSVEPVPVESVESKQEAPAAEATAADAAKEEANILERVSPAARSAYEKGLMLIGRDIDGALLEFQRAASESPELYLASYNAGALLEEQSRFADAEKAYQNALSARPGFGPAVVGLSSLKVRRGDLVGAEEILTKHLDSGVMVRSALAVVLARVGKFDAAIDNAIKVLQEDERNARAMLAMGMMYRRKEMYELATMALNQAIDIDDQLGEAFSELGLVLVAKDEKALAVQAFERAAAANPGVPAILNNLGALRNEVGAFKGATEVLEKAVAMETGRPQYYLNLGNAYRGDQRIVEAETSYKKALELGGGAPQALFNLGVLYLDNEIPDKDMIARYQECIGYLKSYESKVSVSSAEREEIAEHIGTAEKAIEQEEKRRDRAKEREEKDAKKKQEAAENANQETKPDVQAESNKGDASTEEPTDDLGGEVVPESGSDSPAKKPSKDQNGTPVKPADAPETGGV